MKILQLCCFTNLWGPDHTVESIDIKSGRNIFTVPDDYGKYFDLVCAAPPCDQFTKANVTHWRSYPEHFIKIAEKCFKICRSTSGLWFLENPPGRIERFLSGLTQFRVLTWSGSVTNKEYVLYSNFLILNPIVQRYGKHSIPCTKLNREKWQPDLIKAIELNMHHSAP